MIEKYSNKKIIYQALAFLIPFIVYVITLAPTVTFIDSGELAAVATKLGVAHPTGYPFFTILGRVFTLIPVGDEVYRLNLMCAVISSAAMVLFFNLMVFLLKGLIIFPKDFNKLKTGYDTTVFNVSLISTFILAFTLTFWISAVSIEVYSLHSFFLILNIYLFLKACFLKKSSLNSSLQAGKYWILFAFILGLSFTNHLSTIFLAAGFLFLYFNVYGFNKNTFLRIFYLSIPFLLGFSVYAYLFIRSNSDGFNWGYTHNFENFWRHVTAKEFEGRMFTGQESMKNQIGYFTESFPKGFFYFPLILVIPGLMLLWKKNKSLFYFSVLLFLTTIIASVNYNVPDISTYFLLAYIVSSIWIGTGIIFIIEKMKNNSLRLSYLFFILPLMVIAFNYSEANENKNYFVKDYTENIYNSAPENSIIISKLWDFLVSPSLYFQNVKNIRPDIAIIDKELLKRSWYLRYLKQRYPDLYRKSMKEFDLYEQEVLSIESNPELKINPKTGADKTKLYKFYPLYKNLIYSIISNNIDSNKIFITPEMTDDENNFFKANAEFEQVPFGLLIELKKDKSFSNDKIPEYHFEKSDIKDYNHSYLMTMYYNAYTSRANYLLANSRYDEAEELVNKALEIDPVSPEAKNLLSDIKTGKSKAK